MFGNIRLDGDEFLVKYEGKELRYPGTVTGAIACHNDCCKLQKEGKVYSFMMSSDLNHPDEFPQFEDHAIDIVSGYLDGAIKAGLISVEQGTAPEFDEEEY